MIFALIGRVRNSKEGRESPGGANGSPIRDPRKPMCVQKGSQGAQDRLGESKKGSKGTQEAPRDAQKSFKGAQGSQGVTKRVLRKPRRRPGAPMMEPIKIVATAWGA